MRTELLRPPWDWFQDPRFTAPYPTYGPEVATTGRVRAHLMVRNGRWADGLTEPGPSACGYAQFHRSRITVDHGDTEENIDVGSITMLDETPVAYVRVGDDQHGVWVAGGLLPTVSPELRKVFMRGLFLSGQWVDGELTAISTVSRGDLPGFRWEPATQLTP